MHILTTARSDDEEYEVYTDEYSIEKPTVLPTKTTTVSSPLSMTTKEC
jgi:hypothetical protein